MNKEQEISILKAAVLALGNDSYSGGWLRDQLPCIIEAIKSDIEPAAYGVLTWDEARAEAGRIIGAAKIEAKRIDDNTQAQMEQARAYCDKVNQRARNATDIISNMQNAIRKL
jgi:hypothetical protein